MISIQTWFSTLLSILDIDECNLNLSMCQPDSYCNNTIGSYLCICNVGYSGDGFINCTSKSTEDISFSLLQLCVFLLQMSMSVNLTLMIVMRMLSALIPLAALPVLATLDTLEMEPFAVSLAGHLCTYMQ